MRTPVQVLWSPGRHWVGSDRWRDGLLLGQGDSTAHGVQRAAQLIHSQWNLSKSTSRASHPPHPGASQALQVYMLIKFSQINMQESLRKGRCQGGAAAVQTHGTPFPSQHRGVGPEQTGCWWSNWKWRGDPGAGRNLVVMEKSLSADMAS